MTALNWSCRFQSSMSKINAKVLRNAPAQFKQSGQPRCASGLDCVMADPGAFDTPIPARLAKVASQTWRGRRGSGSPSLSFVPNLGTLERHVRRTQLSGRACRLLLCRSDCAGSLFGGEPGCRAVHGHARLQRARFSGGHEPDQDRCPRLGRRRGVHWAGSDCRGRSGRGSSSRCDQGCSGLDHCRRQPGARDWHTETLP